MPEPPETLLAKVAPLLRNETFAARHLGRALAFQALYEVDVSHHPAPLVLSRLTEVTQQEALTLGLPHTITNKSLHYATELVEGVAAARTEIDAIIQERASAYPFAQMSVVDRNVLRIGLYESFFGNAKVPMKAAINEAVELAKLFGSESSAKFVNGVLGRAVEQNAPQHPNPPAYPDGKGRRPVADEIATHSSLEQRAPSTEPERR